MFPKIITTLVIRSTQQGESHGGVYVIDLNSAKAKKVIDWNKMNIDWAVIKFIVPMFKKLY